MEHAQIINGQATAFSVPDIIQMTARLAQIMADEVDSLQAMKLSDIQKLQEEKRSLTSALEQQKSIVKNQPDLMAYVSDEEKMELSQVVEVFNVVLRENHKQLLVAKEVNQRVVQAITDVVNEQSGNPVYTMKGVTQAPRPASLSVTLNQTA